MAADTRARLQDIDPGVHIGDTDDFIHIQMVRMAYFGQFIGKGDIDIPVGVFDHLGHLGDPDICHHHVALTKGIVKFFDLLSDVAVVRPDGTRIIFQFMDHVTGNDPLRCVDQVNILPGFKPAGFYDRPDVLIDGARGNR